MSRVAKRKPQRRRLNSSSKGVTVRRTADGRGWALVHPREARDRAEDLEEVAAMIEVGELDVALDELRWLLSDCSEFIAAHVTLSVGMAPGQPLPPGATSPVLRIGDRCSIGRGSHLVAHRSGHDLNQRLVRELLSDEANYEVCTAREAFDRGFEYVETPRLARAVTA